MRNIHVTLAALLVVAMAWIAPARSEDASKSSAATPSGAHDFDFQFGEWRVHHRVKRATDSQWLEFDGTSIARPLMDGSANVEDNRFDRPTGVTHGVALRTYDSKTHEWAIWWVDGRAPHGALDPPVKGRFKDGVGTFYSDGTVDGKPMRVRFTWSNITATSARWEQAYSFDAEKTWETNWIMEFRRTANSARPL
jgi:hypothetical protein